MPACLGTRIILLRMLDGCHVVGLGRQATLLPECLGDMGTEETEEVWLGTAEKGQHEREA